MQNSRDDSRPSPRRSPATLVAVLAAAGLLYATIVGPAVGGPPTAANAVSMAASALRLAKKAEVAAHHSLIGSRRLLNGAVVSSKIANGSIGTQKLLAGSIGPPQVAPAAITSTALAASAVGTTNLADGSVTTSKLAAGSVTGSTIAPSSIALNDLVGTQVTGTIKAAAGSIVPNGCMSYNVPVAGAQVGDLLLGSFVGTTPIPSGLFFEPLMVTRAGVATYRICNVTRSSSPAITNVGIRVIALR